jgi:Holliday junction resolvase RusA-like endonuclease
MPLVIDLKFRIFPRSKVYYGKCPDHGPDLDNIIKTTIDALSYTKGRGLGIIPDDDQIYGIIAKKRIVQSDDDAGARISIYPYTDPDLEEERA